MFWNNRNETMRENHHYQLCVFVCIKQGVRTLTSNIISHLMVCVSMEGGGVVVTAFWEK